MCWLGFIPASAKSVLRASYSALYFATRIVFGLKNRHSSETVPLGSRRHNGDSCLSSWSTTALRPLRANIDETILLVVITEQGENRNQCEEQWNRSGFPHGFACRGT